MVPHVLTGHKTSKRRCTDLEPSSADSEGYRAPCPSSATTCHALRGPRPQSSLPVRVLSLKDETTGTARPRLRRRDCRCHHRDCPAEHRPLSHRRSVHPRMPILDTYVRPDRLATDDRRSRTPGGRCGVPVVPSSGIRPEASGWSPQANCRKMTTRPGVRGRRPEYLAARGLQVDDRACVHHIRRRLLGVSLCAGSDIMASPAIQQA
jgi:hypothetical protein